jgi:para-nitrobenzyl esterase
MPIIRLALRQARAILVLAMSGACLSACALRPGDVVQLVHSADARPEVVTTRDGPVRGVSASQGRAFLAIPYAAPPVGPLRWAPPQPHAAWTAARDATKGGAICPQTALPGEGRRSEDCLTLNVYTPAGVHAGARLPVMVWIYGGGFAAGYNGQYDVSRLAKRQGVVTVAINYRLGALGFLALPELRGEGSGGFALLDQQAALRWVRDNITEFGGDPGRVTLFGESAGGWSVCEQLTAPGAQGLFQRAIIQSGACTTPLSAIPELQAERGGLQMAADLGCRDPRTALACLRALPATRVLKAKPHRPGLLGKDSWTAAWGGEVLPLSPREALEQGRFMPVPVIDGVDHDEARLFLDTNRLKGSLYSYGSYERIIRDFFGDRAQAVLDAYAPEARRSYVDAYLDIVTASTFSCPALTTDALIERRTPVFAYEFDDPSAVNRLPRAPFVPPLKSFHSSEIAYVLQTPWIAADPAAFSPAQRALSDRIQAEWANFARTGDPNGTGAAVWIAHRDNEAPLQLRPDGDRPAVGYAQARRCNFWRKLGY